MKTRVFPAKTPEELDEKIRESVSSGYIPTIACVFCSVAQPVEQVRAIFAQYQIAVFGCTSSGEIANANAFEESITVQELQLTASQSAAGKEAVLSKPSRAQKGMSFS